MTTLHVPPLAQVEQMIDECLIALPSGTVTTTRRDEVIAACAGPVMMLIEAVRLAGAAGPDCEAVLICCIRRLYAQAEEARRVDHFANLMTKLNQHRQGSIGR